MQPPSNSARVLIIDDDAPSRTSAAEALSSAGYLVSQAADGPNALAQVALCPPDVVLVNTTLSGMDGFEVCRRLSERAEQPRMALIMLMGAQDIPFFEQALESGATDFITKPLDAARLTYRVFYALQAKRMLDESDRQRARLANVERIARLGTWVWHLDKQSFACSPQYLQIVGEPLLRPRCQWDDIVSQVHRDDTERVVQAMNAAIGAGKCAEITYRIQRRDGTECTVHEQMEIFQDAGGRTIRIEGITQDITERVAIEARLRKLADYDELTGLANRRLFGEVMQHALHRCNRNGTKAAVLHIDLDRFKRLNDTFGQVAGDRILRDIAQRIIDGIRASDVAGSVESGEQSNTFARMSGDVFSVFLAEIRRPEDAAMVAQRLCETIAQPLKHAGLDLTLTASIGIAVFPENGKDAGTLIRNAEAAMQSAKGNGAGTYCFFTPSMNASALAKLDMEHDLRRAMERDELLLFYQARVDVPTGRLVGAEALVRWQHPRRGLVPPGEFVPVAEESGLIIPMTAWVLRAACRQLQQWQLAGLPVVPVSINFSAQSFRGDGLCELVAASLREFGLSAHLLEGEITESMLMQDVDRAVNRLKELRAMGIQLAIDDFGTGYSSLAYLKRFPLNVLKIDRAFVKNILTDAHEAAIASTIITLGTAMGMSVVAEGMERVEQANALLARGCRLMQGYLFAKPIPADAFSEILRDGLPMPPGLCFDAERTRAEVAGLLPASAHHG